MKLESMSNQQKITHVRRVARDAEQLLLTQHPLLRKQDVIGFSIFILSIVGIAASGWLYFISAIPAWACVISSAFFYFIFTRARARLDSLYVLQEKQVHEFIDDGWSMAIQGEYNQSLGPPENSSTPP